MIFFAACAANQGDLVAEEARRVGGTEVKQTTSGVEFQGSIEEGMRFCMYSRISSRLLMALYIDEDTENDEELYDATLSLPWEEWLTPDQTLKVTLTTASCPWIRNSHYASLKVKDAICDRLREKFDGNRPDISTTDPDVEVHVHVHERTVKWYIDFSGEEGMWRAIEGNRRIVVLRTMSKAWSLAGARVGIIGSDPEIQMAVMKAKPPYNVSQLSQQAALDMLSRKDEIAGTLSQILSERERFSAFFRTLPFISEVFHSDSNFILVRTSDAERLYDYLAARSIIVRNRSSEPLLQGCLRITVGSRDENDKLMEVLDGYSL